jgi:hypothetical protein
VPNGVFEMPPGVTITNVRVSDDGYATRISGLLTAETDGTFHVQCGAYKDGQQVAAPSGWASDTASGIPAKFDTIDLSSHGTPDHFRCKVTDQ